MRLREGPITAAIYAGSTLSRDFGISITQQVSECWNFCSERGWKIEYVFIDLGENGDLISRRNFREMIREARIGRFDRIVLCCLNYPCSSKTDLMQAERALKHASIPFQSVRKEDE